MEAFRQLCERAERSGHYVELVAGKLSLLGRVGAGRQDRRRDIVELRITDRKHRVLRAIKIRNLSELDVAARGMLPKE